jgi:hypothetical protein
MGICRVRFWSLPVVVAVALVVEVAAAVAVVLAGCFSKPRHCLQVLIR